MAIYYGDGSNSGSGRIIQVVQGKKTDTSAYQLNSSGTSMTWSSDIVSVSITPKDSSSQIWLTASIVATSSPSDRFLLKFYKNTNDLDGSYADSNGSHRQRGHSAGDGNEYRAQATPMSFIDTAGGTSAITYSVRGAQGTGGNNWLQINRQYSGFSDEANRFCSISTITAMEVSA